MSVLLDLDAAATTPVRREALEAAWPYLTGAYGNPSSVHELGEAAARGLEDARRRIAAVLGVRRSDLVLTASGSEAASLAILGLALASPRGRHVVTSPLEHESVLAAVDHLRRLHGFTVDAVPVEADGTVRPEALAAVLRDDTTLVTCALANAEIGAVADLPALAAAAKRVGALVHTDAVQAAGRVDLRGLLAAGVDAYTLSGHKVGAPKGSGLAVVRGRLPLEPLVHGGGQENGRRSGTENVAFAAALAVALELAEAEREEAAARLAVLGERLRARVLAADPSVVLTGPRERLPGHLSFCVPGRSGESVLLDLADHGVLASAGSACAAGRDEPSHVLLALGIDADLARTAVRITLGTGTGEDDVERACRALEQVLRRP